MNVDIRDALAEVRQDIGAAMARLDAVEQAEEGLDDEQAELLAEAKDAIDTALQTLSQLLDDEEGTS
jgi:Ni,Fe-hydrogenase maturation factor